MALVPGASATNLAKLESSVGCRSRPHNPVARGHAGHREACGLHGPGRHVCSKACGEPQDIGQAAVAEYLWSTPASLEAAMVANHL